MTDETREKMEQILLDMEQDIKTKAVPQPPVSPQTNNVLLGIINRIMRDNAPTFALHDAMAIIGYNDQHEHLVMSDTKITPPVEAWLKENVGTYYVEWSWKHYGYNTAGSIYSFKDENKAVLFKLSGLV